MHKENDDSGSRGLLGLMEVLDVALGFVGRGLLRFFDTLYVAIGVVNVLFHTRNVPADLVALRLDSVTITRINRTRRDALRFGVSEHIKVRTAEDEGGGRSGINKEA